jgi:hypothetical protein
MGTTRWCSASATKAYNQLGTLVLDEKSFVDRVVYRLQKWAGVPMEQRYYAPKEGLPHARSLCEGRKRGVCQQTNVWEY